ncbi:MAG: RluA family pseudouridine synthase [Lachnospiraceae bacterium]|jgi:23S rRNA pseudouridine1911/1915/1917 synthase|nr:RluA family pseudouridine synthase [Lachnospiraceae bacterium]
MEEWIISKEAIGERIDKYLAEFIFESGETHSRNFYQKLIEDGRVLINGSYAKSNYKIKGDEQISIDFPEVKAIDIEPEDIPLDILYEDNDVILINKPKNMVVHPAPGHMSGTIVNALMYICKDSLSGINGELRPGIVHRIDKDTTGVIIACKNDAAHNHIAAQLKDHSINRMYRAIAINHFKDLSGTIDAPIGRNPKDRQKMAINKVHGKNAVTHYTVVESLKDNLSHITCKLETGRTHQIRVHMASISHPLLGDFVYGPEKCAYKTEGQCLHAETLGFIHPTTGEYMEFSAPIPDYFLNILRKNGSTF